MAEIYDFEAQTLSGEMRALEDYRGKVLLIVNTASKCGFTPQYEGLEKLYREFSGAGFEILAFPSNQFAGQEPGDAAEIADFCRTSYDVTFPVFAKTDVNGSDAHPLYKWIKGQQKGVLGTRKIKWNFTKFLVDQEGMVRARFGPQVAPAKIEPAIRELLKG